MEPTDSAAAAAGVTPPVQQKKRGRPKGSTKSKDDKDREPTTGGSSAKMRVPDKKNAAASGVVDERYIQWKALVPVLYDWLANHNLVWPSLSCRWGPLLEQGRFKNKQRIYLSEQTDHSVPNTLIIANCDVIRPRVASQNNIANFNEEARSPFVKKYKTLIHPGEVNRIRELPQNKNIVATHTDGPEVLIWDIEAQPNRHAVLGAAESKPDLVLIGHQDNAEFALSLSPTEPFVLSGGKDKTVVLWNINDHVSTLADSTNSSIVKPTDNSPIAPRGIFIGHEDTVEDVQFCPTSSQEFCSVGDDSALILWDARVGTDPVIKVENAHEADLHCVDWNSLDQNLILTGSADRTVRMFDRRKLSSDGNGTAVHTFESHREAVLCVQWCPDKASVFGSCAEDGLVNLWDYEKIGDINEDGSEKAMSSPPGLFFQHSGHRAKVVDFHWNVADPWTIVSVSDDGELTGGGTLQMWRITDLLYRPEEEVIADLQHFKDHIVECSGATTPPPDTSI